jgi:hypothetical protein
MSRYAPVVANADAPEWVSTSAQRPCPICGATSGCRIMQDGEFACCLRTVCEWPVLSGGWLHPLDKADARAELSSA